MGTHERQHIMSELTNLYAHPTRKGSPSHPHRLAARKCSRCQDHLVMGLWLEGDTIVDARFEGHGCLISEVAASLMTEMLVGLSISEVCDIDVEQALALLEIPLSPAKQDCALLSWRIIRALVAWESLQRLV